MKNYLLLGSLLGSMGFAHPAFADEAAQAQNTETMTKLINALKESDSATISQMDPLIDYAVPSFPNGNIAPSQMIKMFASCEPEALSEARRFRDTTILQFICPDRMPVGDCSTGDLEVMIWPGSIGVIEKRKPGNRACRPSAPPPPPPPPPSKNNG